VKANRLSRLQKVTMLLKSPRIALSTSRAIFVLSHMRSRSSALSHVLGSHPKIVGHGELLRGYRSRADMALSRIQLQQRSEHRFFHDKLLHNYTFLHDSLLTATENKIVFLLREPISAAESFVRLYRTERPECNRLDGEVHQDFCDYYQQRLPVLATMAEKIGRRAVLIDSDMLIERAEPTLAALSRFLELATGLKSEFRLFTDSGSSGHGDTTGGLQAAKLQPQLHRDATPVDPTLAQQLIQVYTQCRAAIEERVSLLKLGDGAGI